jgi:flagellar motor protein MotB
VSSSDGLREEAEEHVAWPAFVDLFSATTLLFIAFVGVFIYLLMAEVGENATHRRAILDQLQKQSAGGRLFQVDTSDQQFVRIILRERATFPVGEYRWETLRDSGKVALNRISRVLKHSSLAPLYREVRVLGHSDQSPYPGSDFSNWELSASRAAVVARYLVDVERVDACKVSATGRGPYYPTSRTAEANRRIEIQIVPGLSRGRAPSGCNPRGDRGSRRPAPAMEPSVVPSVVPSVAPGAVPGAVPGVVPGVAPSFPSDTSALASPDSGR